MVVGDYMFSGSSQMLFVEKGRFHVKWSNREQKCLFSEFKISNFNKTFGNFVCLFRYHYIYLTGNFLLDTFGFSKQIKL